jgi:hypothetical protein
MFNTTNRECEPAGTFNIASGNYVDFSLGLQWGQEVNLYYGILEVA